MATFRKPVAFNSGGRTGRKRVTPLQKYEKKEARAKSNYKPFPTRQNAGTRKITPIRAPKTGTQRIFSRATTKRFTSTTPKRVDTTGVLRKVRTTTRRAFYPNK